MLFFLLVLHLYGSCVNVTDAPIDICNTGKTFTFTREGGGALGSKVK